MDKIAKLRSDVINLNIQGATNIALATLEAIKIVIGLGKEINEMQEIVSQVAYARPAEPLAQNSLKYIFLDKNKPASHYLEKVTQYEKLIREVKNTMAESAVSLIKNGGTYLTHCHSSTVVSMFTKAKNAGRKFSVLVTETRPRFQGRITAGELLKAGIEDVTMIIDDVAPALIEGKQKNIDSVFLGADLLGHEGFINKVGSLGIARMCQREDKPLYCLSVLLKFNPAPFSPELLEDRGGSEIWKDAPVNLSFYAPAFDYIPYDTGVNIVYEKGILESRDLADTVHSLYPWI